VRRAQALLSERLAAQPGLRLCLAIDDVLDRILDGAHRLFHRLLVGMGSVGDVALDEYTDSRRSLPLLLEGTYNRMGTRFTHAIVRVLALLGLLAAMVAPVRPARAARRYCSLDGPGT
jgi:hypothetical protein